MRARLTQTGQPMPRDAFSPVPTGIVQRRYACGGMTGPSGECAECQRKRLSGQTTREDVQAPPVVHDVLRGPGRPLDPASRTGMEARFGHDFSQVRVYSGERAAESARTIGAEAYTVGRRVVLGANAPMTGSRDGQRLLAHELAHVVQQRGSIHASHPGTLRLGRSDGPEEREAADAGRSIDTNGVAGDSPTSRRANGTLQRQPASDERPPDPGQQVTVTVGEDGKLTLTASGPKTPAVGSPTIGIQRKPDGRYDLVVGGTEKTVAAGEIPPMLRGALGEAAKPGAVVSPEQRVPVCSQLRGPRGGFMTFSEYSASQVISQKRMALTPAFYDALVQNCRPKPVELDIAPATPPQEAVPPVSPEGTAVA